MKTLFAAAAALAMSGAAHAQDSSDANAAMPHAMPHMDGYASVPAGVKIVPPTNFDPAIDARGIRVLSAPAVIPPGFNGLPATAMGGPLADVATGDLVGEDETYPACTARITDNCVQLYERGATGLGGPYEPAENEGLSHHMTQPSPIGDVQNDLVDTQGTSYIPDNQRGIDMDAAPRDDR